MIKRKFWLSILVLALVFGMTVLGCDGDSTGENGDYQGTYNIWGYYNNFVGMLIPWSQIPDSDPGFTELKASLPTKAVISSSSISCTGGIFDGQTVPARIEGNKLYVTYEGSELLFGTFVSGDFHFTYRLDYADYGAYVLYKK